MKNQYLQTILVGCAWCKSVIDILSHEMESKESKEKEELLLLSHGICTKCSDGLGIDEQKSEKGTSEEDLVFA